MKVKLIANLGTIEFPETPFKDGETHEVNTKLGEKLVKRGLAVALPEEPAAEEPMKPLKPAAVSKPSKQAATSEPTSPVASK